MSPSQAERVLLLDPGISEASFEHLRSVAGDLLLGTAVTKGDGWAAIALRDGAQLEDERSLQDLPAVRAVVEVSTPYRLAARDLLGRDMEVRVELAGEPPDETSGARFGGDASLGIIASSRWGSAAEARFEVLAPLLHEAGCRVFHAGRIAEGATEGSVGVSSRVLAGLRDIAHAHGLALSVEVSSAGQIGAASDLADLLQVGSRNMQDFNLLREMGGAHRPVLLRRGPGATVEEFLLAAEYVLVHGNGRVILCESGIRTFDALHKPRFEINAVPLIERLSHLPLVADPSLTAPRVEAVPAMARAAIAAGADGLVLEVGTEASYDPDGVAIDIETMRRLAAELRPIARAVGRRFGSGSSGTQPVLVEPADVLRVTDRTLAQTIEGITGLPPELDVMDQWHLTPPLPWLSPPLADGAKVLGRCTGYRMGSVRLSRNISYVDLSRIDPTIGALLEAAHLNLGQLFVDPRIEKRSFEFGNHEDAGEIDEVFRRCFPEEADDLYPYVWRRYQAAIDDVVTFLVIEALPEPVWSRLLDLDPAFAAPESVSP